MVSIDFDKDKMIKLRETVKYYEEHCEEVKRDMIKAFKIAKELQEFCAKEGIE